MFLIISMVVSSVPRTSFAGSYGSHMVLQRAPHRAVVWGFTDTAEQGDVTVQLAPASGAMAAISTEVRPYNTSASTWRAVLPATDAANTTGGAPVSYTLSVFKAGDSHPKQTLVNVLFGDVWACSGQSNMAFLLENDMDGKRLVQEANNHPSIRFMTTRKLTSNAPLPELPCVFGDLNPGGCTEEAWSVSNNVSVSDDSPEGQLRSGDDNWLYMSAVCYLYGLDLHRSLGVPIGLINTNWGGTVIEDWLPAAGNAECDNAGAANEDKTDEMDLTPAGLRPVGHPAVPTHLFNASKSRITHGLGTRQCPRHVALARARAVPSRRWHVTLNSLPRLAPADSGRTSPQPYHPWRHLVPRRVQRGGARQVQLPDPGPRQVLAQYVARGLGRRDGRHVPIWHRPARRLHLSQWHRDVRVHRATMVADGRSGLPAEPQDAKHVPRDRLRSGRCDLTLWQRPYSLEARRRAQAGAFGARGRLKGDRSVYAGPMFTGASLDATSRTVTLVLNNTGRDGLALTAMNLSKAFPQANWTGMPFEVCSAPGPCTYDSQASGWAPAATAKLSDDSVVLGGVDASTAVAVRAFWRIYPCEHLGCGLYSKAEGLPPPPFYALLTVTS